MPHPHTAHTHFTHAHKDTITKHYVKMKCMRNRLNKSNEAHFCLHRIFQHIFPMCTRTMYMYILCTYLNSIIRIFCKLRVHCTHVRSTIRMHFIWRFRYERTYLIVSFWYTVTVTETNLLINAMSWPITKIKKKKKRRRARFPYGDR